MKNLILIPAISILMIGASLTGCNSAAEKVENAETKVNEADENLDKAYKEYLEEVVRYREEKAEYLAANQKSIEEFKSQIREERNDLSVEYLAKISDLEKRNAAMKIKMDNYKESGKEKWILFRDEFTHDMQELSQAVKNLTINNQSTN